MYVPRKQLIRCLLQFPPFPCRAKTIPSIEMVPRLVKLWILLLAILLMLRDVVIPLITRLARWLIRPPLHDGRPVLLGPKCLFRLCLIRLRTRRHRPLARVPYAI